MRISFELEDKTVPWADAEMPAVSLMQIPMDSLADALAALGWRLADFQDFVTRIRAASAEGQAKQRGEAYTGVAANLTGTDDIRADQFLVFGSLRAAGHKISWRDAAAVAIGDFHFVPETPAERGELEAVEENVDPTPAATDSAPVAANASTSPKKPGRK